MLFPSERFINTPVMSLQTGSELARTARPIINPHTLSVVAYELEGLTLDYVIDAYRALGLGEAFFTPMFEKLIGVGYVREMILAGASEAEIRACWQEDLSRFRRQRRPYLLYP